MKLDDIVEALTPGVIAAINKGLTFQEMVMAFKLSAVKEARKRSVNNERASILLHMDGSYFRNLLNGTQVRRTKFCKGGKGGKRKPRTAGNLTAIGANTVASPQGNAPGVEGKA